MHAMLQITKKNSRTNADTVVLALSIYYGTVPKQFVSIALVNWPKRLSARQKDLWETTTVGL